MKATQNHIYRDLGGEAVILNTKSGDYFGLNEVGLRVWQIVQQPARLGHIRDILLGEYAVERERCEQELWSLLKKLMSCGLLENASENGAEISAP